MSIINYGKNLGRSFKYAIPQVISNKLPNLSSILKQTASSDGRDSIKAAYEQTNSILKENVGDVLRSGLKNAKSQAMSGKVYASEDEQFDAMAKAMGIDFDSMGGEAEFGGDFGMNEDGSESSSESSGNSNRSTAAAAAIGAHAGVQAAASALGSSPEMQATAEATVSAVRVGKASLSASIAGSAMIRTAIMGNTSVLHNVATFQHTIQKSYYEQSLLAQTAMTGLLSDISGKMSELLNTGIASAAASDQLAQMYGNRKDSSFDKVFSNGSINVNEYLGLLNKRMLNAVGPDSMFSMVSKTFAASPFAMAIEGMLEKVIPQVTSKSLTKIDDFFGDLGVLLTERASHFGRKLENSDKLHKQAGGKILSFFGVTPESSNRPDLSNTIKGKAVAFDGYVHRSLVEVIPSYLADIHAELVSMRRGQGHAHVGNRKLYDTKTGKFVGEVQHLREFNRDVEQKSLNAFSRANRRVDRKEGTSDDLMSLYSAMRDGNLSIDGNSTKDTFAKQLKGLKVDPKNKDAVERASKDVMEAYSKYGSKYLAELQAAITRSKSIANTMRNNAGAPGVEGADRWMFNNDHDIFDAKQKRHDHLDFGANKSLQRTVNGMSMTRTQDEQEDRDIKAMQLRSIRSNKKMRDGIYGSFLDFSEGYDETGKGFGDFYKNESGKVTAKSLFAAPMNLLAAVGEKFHQGVADFLFSAKDPSQPGFLTKMSNYILGEKTTNEHDDVIRKGGLLSGITNAITGKYKDAKKYLFGTGEENSKGVIGELRDKLSAAVNRFKNYMFGEVNEDGKRSGGLLGNTIQKGKDFFSTMLDKVNTTVFQPMKKRLFGKGEDITNPDGTVTKVGQGLFPAMLDKFRSHVISPLADRIFGEKDADGKRQGGLVQKGRDFFSQMMKNVSDIVIKPLKDSLFSKGQDIVDDQGNVITVKRGLFPMVWHSLKTSLINPLADSILGKKDSEGNRQGGMLRTVTDSLKQAFAPLKESIVGEKGIWTTLKKSISQTWEEAKTAFFGKDKKDRKPLSEVVAMWLSKKMEPVTAWLKKAGDWIRERAIEPFSKWLNDPETGLIPRMTKKMTGFLDAANKRLFGEGGMVDKLRGSIERFFQGDKEKGILGFVDRVILPAKKFINEEVINPLKKSIAESWEQTKKFFANEVIEPLKGTLRPFIEEFKLQMASMKEWAKGPLMDAVRGVGTSINNSVEGAFGVSLTDMMKKNVLDPIKEALGSVKKLLGTALGALFKIPVNVIKNVSDELKLSHIKRGTAGYLSPAERARIMGKFGVNPSDVPAGSGSSIIAEAKKAANEARAEKKRVERAKRDAIQDGQKRGFLQSLRERLRGNSDTTAAAVDGGAVSQNATTSVASAAATAGQAPTEAAGGSKKGIIRRLFAGKQTADGEETAPVTTSNSSVENMSHLASVATADNTKNIYNFLTKNMRNTSQYLRAIAKRLGAKVGGSKADGIIDKASGFLGKLFNLITNPIAFAAKLVTSLANGVLKTLSSLIETATNLIMVPIKLISGAAKMAGEAIKGVVQAIGPVISSVAKVAGQVALTAVKTVGSVIKETVGALSSVLAKVPDVVASVAKAVGHTVTAIGKASLAIAKVAGSLLVTVAKIGSEIIKTAANITKNAAMILFKGISSTLGSMFGIRKPKVQPVYVLGGYLASTKMGATSLSQAQASLEADGRPVGAKAILHVARLLTPEPIVNALAKGKNKLKQRSSELFEKGRSSLGDAYNRVKGFGRGKFDSIRRSAVDGFQSASESVSGAGEHASGSFSAIKQRIAAAKERLSEVKWKKGLLKNTGATASHTGMIGKSFGRLSTMLAFLPMIGGGIASLVQFIVGGKLISTLARVIMGGGAAGAIGDMAGGGRNRNQPNRPAGKFGKIASMGKGLLKGLGLGATVAGIAGTGIKSLADKYMDDGAGKQTVKTAGAMLQYGAIGATIGSIVPGVGTVIGGAVGAGIGAAVENWDAISSTAKKAWEYTSEGLKSAWGSISEGISNSFGKFKEFLLGGWDGIKSISSTIADTVLNVFKSFTSNIKDIGTALMKGVTYITEFRFVDDIKSAIVGWWKGNSDASEENEKTCGCEGGVFGQAKRAMGGFMSFSKKVIEATPIGAAYKTISNVASRVLGKPSPEIVDAIKNASSITGVDFGYLMAMAGQESNFNPNAKAGTSSASGLYQFTDGTWREMVKKYGSKYGITEDQKNDPSASAIMSALYAKDNAGIIKSALGKDPTPTDLYMGHFLGSTGAKNFFTNMQKNPNGIPAATQTFSSAAKANASIFYTDKSKTAGRSYSQIYDLMNQKVGAKASSYANQFNTAMTGGMLKGLPTLVGERQPEVVGPDGRVHSSVSGYLNNSSERAIDLARATAVNQAERRMANPDKTSAANKSYEEIIKIASKGDQSDTLLGDILDVLKAIAANTGLTAEKTITADDLQKMSGSSSPSKSQGVNPFLGSMSTNDYNNGRKNSMSANMRNLVTGV